jgi:hypothetical protein
VRSKLPQRPKEQTYSAEVARSFATPYEPSATRPSQVILQAEASAGSAGIEVISHIGGVAPAGGRFNIVENKHVLIPFLCPAGQSYEVTKSAGAGTLASSYLTL